MCRMLREVLGHDTVLLWVHGTCTACRMRRSDASTAADATDASTGADTGADTTGAIPMLA